ncbi:uncharacterized protein [Montipora capricornis]|uniref:uncharacterized protein n=1 Tax=Montipora capricornis TaxID=246305 RepID=UPI0035F19E3F
MAFEAKLQTTVSKVDNFRGKWMRKDDENREQPFQVKRMLSGADVEQQSDERTPATEARVELKFSMVSLSEKNDLTSSQILAPVSSSSSASQLKGLATTLALALPATTLEAPTNATSSHR